MLIGVLHTLYKHPLDTLNVLDLDELEKMYSEAKGSKALEKVPATTAPAKPKAKAPAKTSVKKASEPLPKENPVRINSLPQRIHTNTLLGCLDGFAVEASTSSQASIPACGCISTGKTKQARSVDKP